MNPLAVPSPRSSRRSVRAALGLVAAAATLSPAPAFPAGPAATAVDNPWARVSTPSPGPARAYGGYSAGCVRGAERLPPSGKGFRVAYPKRARVFGHPDLIAFITELGATLLRHGLGTLWLGDLGQPRGGPAPTGHASHQTGLDVDISYSRSRDGSRALPMVDLARGAVTRHLDARVARLLELAAAHARVDRIFVHPAIKQALCTRAGATREWLHKIRPWWGHHDHFHARLSCPAESPECTPQDPLPPGDDCASVAWWFSPEARAARERAHDRYKEKVAALPKLPAPCAALIAEIQ